MENFLLFFVLLLSLLLSEALKAGQLRQARRSGGNLTWVVKQSYGLLLFPST